MSLQVFPSRPSTSLFLYVLNLLPPFTLAHHPFLKIIYVLGVITELYCLLLVKARGAKGPIFEDGPNFDMAFRVFHGRDGVVPLSEGSLAQIEKPLPKPNPEFNPLAAKAATISLSAFGGFFSFGDFSNKRNKKNSNKKNPNNLPQVIFLTMLRYFLSPVSQCLNIV